MGYQRSRHTACGEGIHRQRDSPGRQSNSAVGSAFVDLEHSHTGHHSRWVHEHRTKTNGMAGSHTVVEIAEDMDWARYGVVVGNNHAEGRQPPQEKIHGAQAGNGRTAPDSGSAAATNWEWMALLQNPRAGTHSHSPKMDGALAQAASAVLSVGELRHKR